MRVITWNVARRSSCLAEQCAALAAREPDVVALQEVTDTTLPLWRAVRVSGPDCSDSGMEFLTDASGAFVAAATAAGPPLYRLSWRRSDGVWEAGVPVPVSAPSA